MPSTGAMPAPSSARRVSRFWSVHGGVPAGNPERAARRARQVAKSLRALAKNLAPHAQADAHLLAEPHDAVAVADLAEHEALELPGDRAHRRNAVEDAHGPELRAPQILVRRLHGRPEPGA